MSLRSGTGFLANQWSERPDSRKEVDGAPSTPPSGSEGACTTGTPIPVEDLTHWAPEVMGAAPGEECQLCDLFPEDACSRVVDALEHERTIIWCLECLTRLRTFLAATGARS
jgi:hypothetical protein